MLLVFIFYYTNMWMLSRFSFLHVCRFWWSRRELLLHFLEPYILKYVGVSKRFRTGSITKYTLTILNTCCEATWRVMAANFARLNHKIELQLHLGAESRTICSSLSRRPVRKLLDTPSYLCHVYYYSSASDCFLLKVKVKLSLCFFNWAPRHEGVLGEWGYSSSHSLTSALDGGEWSAPATLHRVKEPLVLTEQVAGWAPEPFWRRLWREKFPAPPGIEP
jgi:hypothetical protein